MATGQRSQATRRSRLSRRTARSGWLFASPAVVLFAVFFVYPLAASLLQSLYTSDRGVAVWAGAGNYVKLMGDAQFRTSIANALLLLVIQVPLMVGLALGLATLLNQAWLKFRTMFRLIHFLPAVTTLVAYSLVFRLMLQTDGGIVNQFLALFGAAPIDFLNNPLWAKASLIASMTWRWTGYNMVLVLAGLQAIAHELYESAALDGADGWRTFRHVVIPGVKPVLLFVSITSTIGTLQLFDENYTLTGGGPSDATLTPVLYLYRVGFRQFDFGYASAIAWAVVLIIMVLSLVQFWLTRGSDD